MLRVVGEVIRGTLVGGVWGVFPVTRKIKEKYFRFVTVECEFAVAFDWIVVFG
jgi:hypothetical protein